jgi:phenylalanyl-tRNA synthetase beta chain
MKISYKWLCELTGLDWSVEETARRLTLCGTACEALEATARHMNKVVVGHVAAVNAIPGADKIRRATVDVGSAVMDVVCGAPNVAVGQKVPVALEGAELAGGFVMKKTKIRGVESAGMICSERELGISADHSGIMVLDADAPVGRPLVEYLDFDDYMMTFELTPNRGDSMSAIGIARDLAALASVKVKRPDCHIREIRQKASDCIGIRIDDPQACPRYLARVIKNVKIGPSPWWLKKRLLTAGVRPISNVVDITNMVMLETGQPLHAFDLKRFGSREVMVRRAFAGEKFTTLDEKEHELTPDVLMITNGVTGVAAAGVMGGRSSEVEADTTEILLEAAFFDPTVIRKSRRQLGMVSESSSRFEKGADPNGVLYAANRAAYLFQELAGGEVLEGVVDCYPLRIEPKKIALRPARCNAILGTAITAERMRQILSDLEFDVSGQDPLAVTAPTFRRDVEREIDLIEEVARIIGYDDIPDATGNIGPLYTPYHREDAFKERVKQVLTGIGFDEMVNHGLADSRKAAFLGPEVPVLRILNPVSEDLDIMRNSLLHTALGVVEHNLSHRSMDLRLFEIGCRYFPPNERGEWVEEERLLLVITGNTAGSWRERPRPLDFYDLSGALERLAAHLHLPAISFEPRPKGYFDEQVSFAVTLNGSEVGELGKITSAVLTKFGIKQPIIVADLALAGLIKESREQVTFKPLPVYPAAPRDLSIVLDDRVPAGQVIEKVRQTAGELARSVEIFDIYTGGQIPKGRKSVAFSINYRSNEGNLSSEEVEQLQQAVVEMLKRDFNDEIRDS